MHDPIPNRWACIHCGGLSALPSINADHEAVCPLRPSEEDQ